MKNYEGEFKAKLGKEPEGRDYHPVPDLDGRREFFEDFLETIDKEHMAASFNLKPEEVTDAEIEEIREFAANVADEAYDQASSGRYKAIPWHDVFHAAEIMKLSKGYSAKPTFLEVDKSEAVLAPEVLFDELYPILFLNHYADKPLSVLIMEPDMLKDAADNDEYFRFDSVNSAARGIAERASRGEDISRHEYQALYEQIVLEVLLDIGRKNLEANNYSEGVVNAWKESVKEYFKDRKRPRHYEEFAKRVFSGEWRDNKRLFIDRFLQDIRSLS